MKRKLTHTTYKIALTITFCLIIFTACVPVNNNTSSKSNTRKERTENRETTVENISKNNSNQRNINVQSRRGSKNQTNENGRIVSNANENTKNRNTKNTANSNPFEKRKNALKNITDEKERFSIDTTYYLLTMENGITQTTSSVDLTGGFANSIEHRENLINSFETTIAEFENSFLFDCNVFRVFANQFSFNDSLYQEAIFYYAECCISNNNLEEAIFVLEALSKEKLNRGVAPKVIVRLGQLHCISGDTKQAERYFKRLKKEFPRSIYNQIADCMRL